MNQLLDYLSNIINDLESIIFDVTKLVIIKETINKINFIIKLIFDKIYL